MTNTIAIFLAGAILVGLAADYTLYGSEHMVFLGKELAKLIEWLAFWR